MNKQNIFFLFSPALEKSLSNFEKHICGSTKTMGNLRKRQTVMTISHQRRIFENSKTIRGS
jgi:hypothetical protein